MSQALLTLPTVARAPLPPPPHGFSQAVLLQDPNPGWVPLRRRLSCGSGGRVYCLFSGGGRKKQEQAKKALEGALGQKKTEFEKWNMEIERRRRRRDRGNTAGGGGWFGGGGVGWFRWLGSGDFWDAAKQTILTILGIVALFFLIANGNVLVAIVVNSLLSVLRHIWNALSFLAYCFSRKTWVPVSGADSGSVDGKYQAAMPAKETSARMSAKERVVRKWGMD